jgi:cysteine-rich repeat protein
MRLHSAAVFGVLFVHLTACSGLITDPPNPQSVCGNGKVETGEACDDGNTVDTDGCSNACTERASDAPVCGNGKVETGEACDDGNTVDTDACTTGCKAAECGDGFVQANVEACDDGNTVNTDTCTATCAVARCGDGIVLAGVESCDDGNQDNTDACTNACAPALCGDGFVQAGEACDDGNQDNTDTCTNTCKAASCGDGFVQAGEACDDGNTVNTDTCTTACKAAACGDGHVQAGEACDDGNTVDTDGCRNTCALPSCGDGVVQAGEACDDGNTVNTDACLTTCVEASCGDGIVHANVEQCDDGNPDNTDDCLVGCFDAYCGDNFVHATAEACDDGNASNTDACLDTCAEATCGDGFTYANVEQCDDKGDSALCDKNCSQAECGDGYVNTAAGEDCDDQNSLNSDGCTRPGASPKACAQVTNTAPTANAAAVTLDEDTLAPAAVTLTGSDAEDATVTFSVATPPAHGTLAGTPPNLTYLPDPDFFGLDSFTFTVNDGVVDSQPATVSLNVTAVADAPVASDATVSTDEDTQLALTLSGDDRDGDALTFNVLSSPGNGSLSAVGADGNITYSPVADFAGDDSFTFSVTAGGETSAVATVFITVNPVNDAPVVNGRKYLVRAGQPSLVKVDASDLETATRNLTYKASGAGPQKGTLAGTFPDLSYTPNPGATGVDTFSLNVIDEGGSFATATFSVYLHTPSTDRLSVGGYHACAVMGNGAVKCWGNNDNGQLGMGATGGNWGDEQGELAQGAPAVDLGTHADGTPYTALSVSSGLNHSCAVLDDHTVKCWGSNEFGALGAGGSGARATPTHVLQALDGVTDETQWPVLQGVQSVSAGELFTCALLDDNGIKCWGLNNRSLLGLGTAPSVLDPNLPQAFTDAATDYVRNDFDLDQDNAPDILRARRVQAGGWHACALTLNDEVTCWGHGGDGDVGRGTPDFATRPGPAVDVGTGRRVVAMELGNAYHTCVLLDDATLKCWGYNYNGQLGGGDTTSRGNAAGQMGDDLPAIDVGQDRVALEAGTAWEHTCARLDDGQVKCWGRNDLGQLGLGTNSGNTVPTDAVDLGTGRTAVSLSVDGDVGCVLFDTDEVKCWGHNAYGQLGLGDVNNRGDQAGELGDTLPVSIDLTPAPMARSRKLLVRPGETTTFEIPISDMDDPELALTIDDSALSGTVTRAGLSLSYAPPAGAVDGQSLGQLVITGTDGDGQSATATLELFIRAPQPTPPLSVGVHHACAVMSDGAVKCWGSNDWGKLGNGTMWAHWGDEPGETAQNAPAADLGPGQKAVSVAAGAHHTCALLETGRVKCWGLNGTGFLGTGDTLQRSAPPADPVDLGTHGDGSPYVAKSISVGQEFSCAVLDDDTVKCWGDNRFGQLGVGDTNNTNAPTLPVRFPDGTALRARALVTGEWHACAITLGGDVTCWGADYGVLGQGTDIYNVPNPGIPTRLGFGLKALELSRANAAHTCAVLDDGNTKCWGNGGYGQLGVGDSSNRGKRPSEMGDNLPAVDFGTGRMAYELATGGAHTCARLDNGQVKCWGNNDNGALGLGGTSRTTAPTSEVDLGTGRLARAVSAGGNTTCVLLGGDEVKCWGYNGYGQLGLSDNQDRGDAPGELGDALNACIDLTPAPVARSRKLLVRPDEPTTFEIPISDMDSPVLSYLVNDSGLAGTVTRGGRFLSYAPPTGAVDGQSLGQLVITGTDGDGQSATATLDLSIRAPQPTPPLSVGVHHACAVMSDGAVKCWGSNDWGKLGNGTMWAHWGDEPGETAQNAPAVDLGPGQKAVSVAAGAHHTCALLDDGNVKCWGLNGTGFLGTGDTNQRSAPPANPVNLGSDGNGLPYTARAISVGEEFSCAVLHDDSVKCWGDNRFGQLGVGDYNTTNAPTLPVAYSDGTVLKARALTTGAWHACALLFSGDVTCWGHDYGVLGQGTDIHSVTRPTIPTRLGLKALELSRANAMHTCAVLDDGSSKCWGNGGYGQLGLGDSNNRGKFPTQMGDNLPAVDFGTGRMAFELATGGAHTCARLDNGQVKCWGNNDNGALGLGDTARTTAPTSPVDLGTGRLARAVSAGGNTTCALLDGDQVKCWGYNGYGQLGLSDNQDRGDQGGELGDSLPVSIDLTPAPVARSRKLLVRPGETTTFEIPIEDMDSPVLDYNVDASGLAGTVTRGGRFITYAPPAGATEGQSLGRLVVTGTDPQGQVATANVDLFVHVPAPTPPVSMGIEHACALMGNGAVKCWGSNEWGQLGIGNTSGSLWAWGDEAGESAQNTPAVDLGTHASGPLAGQPHTAREVVAGYHHTCAVLDDGSVKCWGGNWKGFLGTGDTNGRSAPPANPVDLGLDADGQPYTAKSVAVGQESTCALLHDDSVKCWGDNRAGQLGLGDQTDRFAPSDRVLFNGEVLRARALATGPWRTCAQLFSGEVTCWGDNGAGQLGIESPQGAAFAPAQPVRFDRYARVFQLFGMNAPHACALLDNGDLKCWGDGGSGQLGLGNTQSRGAQPGSMGERLPAVDLGTGRMAVQVATGVAHTCARLDDATVKCWGANATDIPFVGYLVTGQLGLEGSTAYTVPQPTDPASLGTGRVALAVTAGRSSCALLNGGDVKCWGINRYGQLGLGDGSTRGDNAGELGDNLPVCIDLSPPPPP